MPVATASEWESASIDLSLARQLWLVSLVVETEQDPIMIGAYRKPPLGRQTLQAYHGMLAQALMSKLAQHALQAQQILRLPEAAISHGIPLSHEAEGSHPHPGIEMKTMFLDLLLWCCLY